MKKVLHIIFAMVLVGISASAAGCTSCSATGNVNSAENESVSANLADGEAANGMQADGKTGGVAAAARFSGDSARAYVQAQVDMGPRVPGTAAHRRCGDWIEAELTHRGADTVMTQIAPVKAFTGETFQARNILGRFEPQGHSAANPSADRILLVAHWDTRPWADNEPDKALRDRPVPGANDGGSGVGVLLEMARLLAQERPQVGVDLLFVDMEDMGESDPERDTSETWCLGTQAWVDDMPYTPANRPRYALLLDMVGDTGAQFHREMFSNRIAPGLVSKVWAKAKALGLQDRFPSEAGGAVVDDHLFLYRAGIPAIDIIESQNPQTGTFASTWHTLADDMDHISAATLEAVGRVVTATLWDEKPSKR